MSFENEFYVHSANFWPNRTSEMKKAEKEEKIHIISTTSLLQIKFCRGIHHRCSVTIGLKFREFYRKTPVLNSLFNKSVGLKACNFIRDYNTGVFL